MYFEDEVLENVEPTPEELAAIEGDEKLPEANEPTE
jgi:hypothetical protein